MGTSWVNLENVCPLEISDFISKAKPIADSLDFTPDLTNLDKYKMDLLKTKSDIEVLVGELVSLLRDPELQKSVIDSILYDFLKKDFAGYMAIIDEKQEQHLEAHDGEVRAGVGRTMAFRGVLRVALYGIIYGSLYDASVEYNKLPNEFIVKERRPVKETKTSIDVIETKETEEEMDVTEIKGKNTFLRILFHILSIKLSVLGGLERRKPAVKRYSPASWKNTYTKEGKEQLAKVYKEETGQDLTQDILREEDLFAESPGEEDVSEHTQ